MSGIFTLYDQIERHFPIGDGEEESAHPVIAITYRYIPGYTPGTPPGEYGPIDPPESEELELIEGRIINDDGMHPTAAEVQEWAKEYLDSDSGREFAIEQAIRACQPDPDEARERRDDALRDR